MRPIVSFIAVVLWTIGILLSMWAQRNLLDDTVEALARNDAVANLRKDMAIRKWAGSVNGVYIDDAKVRDNAKLGDQPRVEVVPRSPNEPSRLVWLAPVHILMAIQATHEAEYGVKERLTSQQLRDQANAPDNWESEALKSLQGGAESVASVVNKGGHGVMRLMIPMRMDKECLECHRDTLVPVGGLRGGAAISIDLNTYRNAQEPTWRAIQTWHGVLWLLGVGAIGGLHVLMRRRDAERAAREEERQETALAFGAMAEGAILTDRAGKILWVNDAACQITGYAPDELIGATPRMFKSGHHDAAFYAGMWRSLLETGQWEGEIWNRRKAGAAFPEKLSVRSLRDAQGQIRRFVCIFSDITERKSQEQQLRDLNANLEHHVRERTEELARANKELEAFSYSISHDLRAPLRALDGFARILVEEEGDRLSPEGSRLLERIWANAGKMGNLIDDVLNFSRVGRAEMNWQEIDMTALARGVAEEMRGDYPATQIRIAELPTVMGDKPMVRQVWSNLIGNALKFSSKRERPAIEIDAETLDGEVVFCVRDNGAGFDMTYADRLFGVFQRLHTEADFPGTGAGLSIVKRVVERHGGRVWAEGEVGKGARFRFSLGG
ncbi:MAG: ATP-binding protein [Ignavibacteria bacterium]